MAGQHSASQPGNIYVGRRFVILVAWFVDAGGHPLEGNLEKKFEATLVRAIRMDPRLRQVIQHTVVTAFHGLCQCLATGRVGMIGGASP